MVLFMEEPVALVMDMGSMHIESMHMGSMDMRSMDMGTLGEHEHGEHARGELCYGGAFMAGCLARLWRDVWRVYGGGVDKGQHSPRWRGGGKEKEFVERLVDSGVVVENRKTLCIGFW